MSTRSRCFCLLCKREFSKLRSRNGKICKFKIESQLHGSSLTVLDAMRSYQDYKVLLVYREESNIDHLLSVEMILTIALYHMPQTHSVPMSRSPLV